MPTFSSDNPFWPVISRPNLEASLQVVFDPVSGVFRPLHTNESIHSGSIGYNNYRTTGVTTGVQTIKDAGGNVFSWNVINPNAVAAYLKAYDITGSVVVGTTTPKYVFQVNASTNLSLRDSELPWNFTGAIKIAATSGYNDNATGQLVTPLLVEGLYY